MLEDWPVNDSEFCSGDWEDVKDLADACLYDIAVWLGFPDNEDCDTDGIAPASPYLIGMVTGETESALTLALRKEGYL